MLEADAAAVDAEYKLAILDEMTNHDSPGPRFAPVSAAWAMSR